MATTAQNSSIADAYKPPRKEFSPLNIRKLCTLEWIENWMKILRLMRWEAPLSIKLLFEVTIWYILSWAGYCGWAAHSTIHWCGGRCSSGFQWSNFLTLCGYWSDLGIRRGNEDEQQWPDICDNWIGWSLASRPITQLDKARIRTRRSPSCFLPCSCIWHFRSFNRLRCVHRYGQIKAKNVHFMFRW